jgi:hypothetical protein
MPVRQEVLNVLTAELLSQYGMVAVPEQILSAKRVRHMPDVIVDLQGLRLALEGEFDTAPDKKSRAMASAWRRVEEGIAHVGVAVLYPKALREAEGNLDDLRERLGIALLQFAIVTEADERQAQLSLFGDHVESAFKDADFNQGTVNHLAEALRRAYDEVVGEGVVDRAVETLEAAMDTFHTALRSHETTTERFASVLGMKGD